MDHSSFSCPPPFRPSLDLFKSLEFDLALWIDLENTNQYVQTLKLQGP